MLVMVAYRWNGCFLRRLGDDRDGEEEDGVELYGVAGGGGPVM